MTISPPDLDGHQLLAAAWRRERKVMLRVRLISVAIFVATAVAVRLAHHPHGLGYLGYCTRSDIESAAIAAGVLIAPGVAVVVRPTRLWVGLWLCVGVPFACVGFVLLSLTAMMALIYAHAAELTTLWPAAACCALAGAVLVAIVGELPIIRFSHERPSAPMPKLPRAWLHAR
jgi:hypothetical protein